MVASFALALLLHSPDLTLKQVEDRLVRNGYTESMFEAYWAAKQGAKIVPLLDKMLSQKSKYLEGEATGAFPFNAEYALAHIDLAASLAVLKKHGLKQGAKGWSLRRKKKSPNYGIVNFEIGLHPKPNQNIGSVLKLKPGTEVRILKRAIENPKEENARGGPATYDYVEILGSKRRGYTLRAGDNFDPFM